MKIGILTLPLHYNYGGILQAWALQTILKRMGHEVCIVEKNRYRPMPLFKAPFVYAKRIVKKALGQNITIFSEYKIRHEMPVITQNTFKFVDKYINRRIYDDFSEIQETDFDAIIVGSDQVWRPRYFHPSENAYLGFSRGWKIKRIAYAASFGTDNWEYTQDQTQSCGKLAQSFDAVSVREESGVGLCQSYFGVKAKHVLDPTMLLCGDDYKQLFIANNTPQSPGNLLVYILDETEDKTAIIERIAKDKGLKPFRVNSRAEEENAPLLERIQPSVEQWLRGFYDAKFVVTDSFHACVFSILFNKPFIVIGNENRGMSRFTSLLSMFGLEECLFTSVLNSNLPEINFEKVNHKLNHLRESSMRFLCVALYS